MLSTIAGAVIVNNWYAKSRDELVLDIAAYVGANTNKSDTVLTNLFENPTLEYYAFRKMVWNLQPEDVTTQAIGHSPAVYFYCPWLDAPDSERPASDEEALAACELTKVSDG